MVFFLFFQMILLENVETQKKHLEKRCEDMAGRLREKERVIAQMQHEIKGYKVVNKMLVLIKNYLIITCKAF